MKHEEKVKRISKFLETPEAVARHIQHIINCISCSRKRKDEGEVRRLNRELAAYKKLNGVK